MTGGEEGRKNTRENERMAHNVLIHIVSKARYETSGHQIGRIRDSTTYRKNGQEEEHER